MCFVKHTWSHLSCVLISLSCRACIQDIIVKVRIRLWLFTLLYADCIFILNLACWVGAHSKVQCAVLQLEIRGYWTKLLCIFLLASQRTVAVFDLITSFFFLFAIQKKSACSTVPNPRRSLFRDGFSQAEAVWKRKKHDELFNRNDVITKFPLSQKLYLLLILLSH